MNEDKFEKWLEEQIENFRYTTGQTAQDAYIMQGNREGLESALEEYRKFKKSQLKENQRVRLKTKTIDREEITGFINAVWNEGEEGEAKGFPDGMRYYVVTIPIDYSDWRGSDELEVIEE